MMLRIIKEVWAQGQPGPIDGGGQPGPIDGGQGKPVEVEFPNPISSPTVQALIADITNWLINIGLAIAVLMLIYGALVFITAGGSEEKVKQGKRVLTWSVVGLATLLLAKGAEFVIRSFLV